MNIIKNTALVRLFLVILMAEGVACVDMEMVLFRTKPTKLQLRVDFQDGLARLLYRHGQSLKSGRKSPRGNPAGGYPKQLFPGTGDTIKDQVSSCRKLYLRSSWRP